MLASGSFRIENLKDWEAIGMDQSPIANNIIWNITEHKNSPLEFIELSQ